mgnify:CR=1 FL=1
MTSKNTIDVFFIPADMDEPCKVVNIKDDWQGMAKLINAQYVDVVQIFSGKHVRLDIWVDDEGLLFDKPYNRRASVFTSQSLVGDALLAGSNSKGESLSVDGSMVKKFYTFLKGDANVLHY